MLERIDKAVDLIARARKDKRTMVLSIGSIVTFCIAVGAIITYDHLLKELDEHENNRHF